jgi:hypothetical protein
MVFYGFGGCFDGCFDLGVLIKGFVTPDGCCSEASLGLADSRLASL